MNAIDHFSQREREIIREALGVISLIRVEALFEDAEWSGVGRAVSLLSLLSPADRAEVIRQLR